MVRRSAKDVTGGQFAAGGWRNFALGAGLLAGLLVAASGIGEGLDRTLREFGAHLRRHPASGSLHIVEIDARSIAEIDRWPWPRGNYARLLDQLHAAGAASVAFDVDFSSRSDPAEDRAFAAALARADGQAILPTFGQWAGSSGDRWTDSLPAAQLREHAALAAVSIRPDLDGYVRNVPFGTITRGLARPSMAAMLAQVDGKADHEFPVDYAIDPTTIPRHSFIDIRDGRFDRGQIAGKDILIGATAIEMGDRYVVPNHGVLPGVVIQALAAETLLRGVPRAAGWLGPLLVALAAGGLTVQLRRRWTLATLMVFAPAATFALALAAQDRIDWIFDLAPALAALCVIDLITLATRLLAAAGRRRSLDPQTGLPNRRALRWGHAEASTGIVVARFADYDKLSVALGEATGDLILRVHDRIALTTRGSRIYRVEDRVLAWRQLPGDAFETCAAALRALMMAPVEVRGRRIDVSLALGFAASAADGDDDEILARALMAADHALAEGLPFHVHDPLETEKAEIELSLLGELDEAIVNGDILVVYQPKLCLQTDAITSVEALVRWQHRRRGFLSPDQFIGLAERNDRIAGLTLHVVERTMADLETWSAAGHAITAAVNISAKLLNAEPFLETLRQLVARSATPPSRLIFEITESAAVTNTDEAAAALQLFRDLGIAISMDDYGTGQSTLSYLKRLPLSELKVDRSFVQHAHRNRSDGLLVQSTVSLAHDLGIKVVAEGVEDPECLEFLRSVKCDFAQGYLISKPVPPDNLLRLLQREDVRAA